MVSLLRRGISCKKLLGNKPTFTIYNDSYQNKERFEDVGAITDGLNVFLRNGSLDDIQHGRDYALEKFLRGKKCLALI